MNKKEQITLFAVAFIALALSCALARLLVFLGTGY